MVFLRRRDRERLTTIFLRQAEQAAVFCPLPVEALDHERLGAGKCPDLGGVHRQPEGFEQLQTVIFIFDAVRQIDTVRQLPDLGFEYVRCRCRSVGLEPFSFIMQQGGFFLRARDRDTELVVAAQPERRLYEAAQQLFDRLVIDGFAFDCSGRIDGFVFVSDELQGPDTIMADRRQHAVGVRSARADFFCHPAPQSIGVGQQVLEDCRDGLAPICAFPQRQRKGNRNGVFPAQPALVIPKADGPA